MPACDLLIHARWVIPVEPGDTALEHHSIAVSGSDIVAVLPTPQAREQFQAHESAELDRHAIIPGLVNAHTHASMSLFRGLADDLPLMEWLNGHVWPAETKWVSEEFIRDGAQLALAEMIRGGTTCFNDMYFFPDVVADVARAAGMRASVGMIMIDFPTAYARNAEEYLQKGLALHDRLRHDELVRAAFAPHAPYTVSDEPLGKIRVLADELDVPVHMHVHETVHEIEESMARFGVRPLERLGGLDLLSPRLMAVHMTQLLPAEMEAIAAAGVHVVHCPESNLKLASGFCPAAKLLGAGVNLALGTDGAASNNDLNMLGEMRTAALLAKGVAADPTALPADTALRAATLGGARALGWDERIGSLTAGKAADVVAIDLGTLCSEPVYDPVSQIVYTAGRDQVSDVWINGRRVLRSGELTTLDAGEVMARARTWRDRVAQA
jgi:5-methylthioadenosine/S-adenosylhomocysteine deaminase